MPPSRDESHVVPSRKLSADKELVVAKVMGGTFGHPVVREDTIQTSDVASIVPDDEARSTSTERTSTALVIQLLFLALFVVGVAAFVVQRRRRHKRQLRSRQQTRQIRHISAPNGLDPGPGGNIAPSYQEALKSPVVTASSVYASSQQRQRSDEALMDQCWAAVYQVEGGGSLEQHGHGTASNERSEPTTPRVVPRSSQRQSVSRWLRDHLPGTKPRSSFGPLSSHPPRTETSANLPAPPSPSYTSIPVTPTASASAPRTPSSTTHPAPMYSPYLEPLSVNGPAATGGDRSSMRGSITNSVLIPLPLQPAPPPRRLSSEARRNRESISSVEAYGAATWRTITPHEDPPEYEPRRGDPDSVSPV